MRIEIKDGKNQFDTIYDETIEHKCSHCGVNILDISIADMWLSSWFYPDKASFRCCNCNGINTVTVEDSFKRFCMRSHTKSKNHKVVKLVSTTLTPWFARWHIGLVLMMIVWMNTWLIFMPPLPSSMRVIPHILTVMASVVAASAWRD